MPVQFDGAKICAVAKRILIVDDEVALLRITREALVASFRCEVDTSPTPEYGFELALKQDYDLFIFDFSMPMIDGAMLFFLIGKVYNNIDPARDRAAVAARVRQRRRGSRSRVVERTGRRGIHCQAIFHEPAFEQGLSNSARD